MSSERPPERPPHRGRAGSKPATPVAQPRALPPMPRRERPAGPEAPPSSRLGRRWPLPLSPVATALLLAFLLAAGLAWATEGRFTTTPAEARKLASPYAVGALSRVEVTTPSGSATYTVDAAGKLVAAGPTPVPTPTPGPDATPGPVTVSPSGKLTSTITQLHETQPDRVLLSEASSSPDYGLDQPQLTIKLVPKSGQPLTLAVGKLTPDSNAYYVRRDERRDTVLISRYVLDDVVKSSAELVAPAS